MQKVIQRSKTASRRAAQRLSKEMDHLKKGQDWSRKQEALRLRRFNHSLIAEARQHRKEAWETGPLAPRRDVGDQKDTYGAVPIFNFNMPDRAEKHRPKWYSISEGDRVVVLKGRNRGKIGVVDDLNKDKAVVRIKDVNVADVSVPKWLAEESAMADTLTPISIGIPIEDVRLVYPLPDPDTKTMRDVIIERLTCVDRQWDRVKREWDDGMRAIAGTNTLIPWPEKADPEFTDYEEDTLSMGVEEESFRPYLLNPPMPLSVINELRNKYSQFRTRHDWEYVQKKEAEDARLEKRGDLYKSMRTPLQELADVRKKEQDAARRELTDEQLAKIGEVIARERAKSAGAETVLE